MVWIIVWGSPQMTSKGFTIMSSRRTRALIGNHSGFTIIELLIVISIITLVGSFMVPRFLQFKDSQDLLDNAGKLQSAIKLTQNNAQSSFSCGDAFNPTQKTIDWRITITRSNYTISPNCSNSVALPTTTTTLSPDIFTCNIIYDDGGTVSLPANCDGSINAITTFDNLTGSVNFIGQVNRSRMVVILSSTVTNSKTGIFIEKGGLIYTSKVQ